MFGKFLDGQLPGDSVHRPSVQMHSGKRERERERERANGMEMNRAQ